MNQIERITPRATDLGEGLLVHRALPTRQRRMVGAWCFLDHAGPVTFPPGQGMKVGAHPHTALQTFTWMIEGAVMHRDSLGNELIIRPGQVNLMTAGHGIAHTEDSLADSPRLHAAQLWIALPSADADCAPAFDHYPELPEWIEGASTLTLLAGEFAGRAAPTRLYSPLLGMDIHQQQSGALDLPLNPVFEYGLLALEGGFRLEGEAFAIDEFAYLPPGRSQLRLELEAGSRVLLLGGEPFPEPIVMWWNFVGHSQAAITEAYRAWTAQEARFGDVPGGEGRRLVAPAPPWVNQSA